MTDARARRRTALGRLPVLLLFGIGWVPLTVLVGLPVRWLFDRAEPLDEALFQAALSIAWIGPAMALSRRVTARRQRAEDPEGEALRDAVRHGRPPRDDRLRAALPAHLDRQRRATLLGLALVLLVCAGLSALALSTPAAEVWVPMFGLVAAVSAGAAALTLIRVRRLEPRLSPPGQDG